MCMPKKGDFITITKDIISSIGSQKLEFYSKKYPHFHSRQTSFILKKGEWYQIGSIYILKSNVYFKLQLQRSKTTRIWMRKRINDELEKLSSIYSDKDDYPILKSRSLECFGNDLNKKCLVFSDLDKAIKARKTITQIPVKYPTRWKRLP